MSTSALALSLAGCGDAEGSRASSNASPASSGEGVVTIADKREPNTLDPALMWDAYDGSAGALVHQGLARFAESSTAIEPALAESWEIAPDGLSATFRLRPDAFFHDGSPVTAWDVEYSVARVLDPEVGSQRRWIFEPYLAGWDKVEAGASTRYAEAAKPLRGAYAESLSPETFSLEGKPSPAGVAGLNVLGPKEIEFRFDKPYLPFLTMLAMPNASVIPLGSAEAAKAKGVSFGREPVGAGPWKLAEWTAGERLAFEPFKAYWEGPPAAPGLVYRAIDVESTWRAEFTAGNVDFYSVSAADFRSWRENPAKRDLMVEVPELNIYFLAFNTTKPRLADPRVRRALALGLDTGKLFEYLALGRGTLARGPVPPNINGFQGKDLPEPKRDLEEARRLLAEAGAEGLEVRLYHQNNRFNSDLMQSVRADWNEIGVSTVIKPLDRAAFEEARRQGEPDAYFGSWWADYPDIDNFVFPLFHSSNIGSSNGSRYANAEVDALIARARFLPNHAERMKLFREAESLIVEDAPMIFLWHRASTMAVAPNVRGYKPHPMLNGQNYHSVSLDGPR